MVNPSNKRNWYIWSILSVILIVIGGITYNVKHGNVSLQHTRQPSILFPLGGETLIAGQTYTLSWVQGGESIHIFLIDTSLKEQGASVSISDRIYNIPNTGSYTYTVPLTLPSGEYQFQIGTLESKPVHIIKK